ncbi:MAG: PGPGW domain-containing protein [Propionibacterium sp.]|nr:PGPGW domain-containing protein [Propionibacterium sp.]
MSSEPGHRPDDDESVLEHVEEAWHEFDEQHHVLRTVDDGDRFRWRARIRRNPYSLFWYRVAVGGLGLLLMVAAALTGWLPGPGGIPLFLLGLAVWSSEFAWAKRLMDWFKSQFTRFRALDRRTKRRVAWLSVGGVIASWYAVAAVAGLPEWLPDPISGFLSQLPGIEPTAGAS